jgi:hypothetical protein
MSDDPHLRFRTWLLDGAQGDPPRDLALHASLCADCMALVAAHDALAHIDVGRAPLPPLRPTPIRSTTPLRQAGGFAVAITTMILVGGAVIVVALQILGRAAGEPEKTGGVLAASGSPKASSLPASSTYLASPPGSSASATASASSSATPQTPGLRQPQATMYPVVIPAAPRPSASIAPASRAPTPSPPPQATVKPSPSTTPSPSATPAQTPSATPSETPSPSPS